MSLTFKDKNYFYFGSTSTITCLLFKLLKPTFTTEAEITITKTCVYYNGRYYHHCYTFTI